MVWKKISAGMLMVAVCSLCAVGMPRQARAELIISMDPARLQAYYDHASLFPSVGWVDVIRSDNSVQRGGGVLVAPDRVLTAAHFSNDAVGFTYGTGANRFNNQGTVRSSTTAYRHPSFVSAGVGYDLAMIYLPEPIFDITPAALFEFPLTLGMEIHLTGYGGLGVAGTPNENLVYNGDRFAGIGTLDNFPFSSDVHFQSRFWDPLLRPNNPLGIRGTPGSSGGGIFTEVDIYDEDGNFLRTEFQLIGLHSYVSTNNLYNSSSFPTMIDVAWVNGHIASTAVPEPSSGIMATIGIGLAAMITRRRKRTLSQ